MLNQPISQNHRSENLYISHRMSNGPKAFFNQTDLKHVQTTRYLGQKTFRLESSRSEYTAPLYHFGKFLG